MGIIGYPLSHSISPDFQQAALDYCAIDANFHSWEIQPDDLESFFQNIRTSNFSGASVTIPHKEKCVELVDKLSPSANLVGAVNCIVKTGNKLVGHNTDGTGFIRALKAKANFNPKGKKVLLIGAGGASKAIAHALIKSEIAELTIANRTLDRGDRLARQLKLIMPNVDAIDLNRKALLKPLGNVQLIVNSTSIGMKNGPDPLASPIPEDLIPSNVLVNDIVYNPPDTPLITAARKNNACTLGGLDMLVYQGIEAFELWTNKDAPETIMYAAAEKALGI